MARLKLAGEEKDLKRTALDLKREVNAPGEAGQMRPAARV